MSEEARLVCYVCEGELVEGESLMAQYNVDGGGKGETQKIINYRFGFHKPCAIEWEPIDGRHQNVKDAIMKNLETTNGD